MTEKKDWVKLTITLERRHVDDWIKGLRHMKAYPSSVKNRLALFNELLTGEACEDAGERIAKNFAEAEATAEAMEKVATWMNLFPVSVEPLPLVEQFAMEDAEERIVANQAAARGIGKLSSREMTLREMDEITRRKMREHLGLDRPGDDIGGEPSADDDAPKGRLQ